MAKLSEREYKQKIKEKLPWIPVAKYTQIHKSKADYDRKREKRELRELMKQFI